MGRQADFLLLFWIIMTRSVAFVFSTLLNQIDLMHKFGWPLAVYFAYRVYRSFIMEQSKDCTGLETVMKMFARLSGGNQTLLIPITPSIELYTTLPMFVLASLHCAMAGSTSGQYPEVAQSLAYLPHLRE